MSSRPPTDRARRKTNVRKSSRGSLRVPLAELNAGGRRLPLALAYPNHARQILRGPGAMTGPFPFAERSIRSRECLWLPALRRFAAAE